MSQHHRITYVHVDAFEEEELEMDRVMGKVPVEEMREALESNWGKDAGWRRDAEGADYRLCLPHGVSMRLRMGKDGRVTLKRAASSLVDESLRNEKKSELEKVLAETKEQYNLAFNDLLAQALLIAIPKRARELGYEVMETKEQIDRDSHVYDLEMKMAVNI